MTFGITQPFKLILSSAVSIVNKTGAFKRDHTGAIGGVGVAFFSKQRTLRRGYKAPQDFTASTAGKVAAFGFYSKVVFNFSIKG
jgi:hypothetical protein